MANVANITFLLQHKRVFCLSVSEKENQLMGNVHCIQFTQFLSKIGGGKPNAMLF